VCCNNIVISITVNDATYIKSAELNFADLIIIIIIIIIFINCNWVVTWWQWLLYMYTNMKKKGN